MEIQGHNFIQSMTTWPVYTCAVITMVISSVIEYRIVVIDTHIPQFLLLSHCYPHEVSSESHYPIAYALCV